jgi:hypothetical protein
MKETLKRLPSYTRTWTRFRSWVSGIQKDKRLTKEERIYIRRRIVEELSKTLGDHEFYGEDGLASFWDAGPIKLSCLFLFTNEDRRLGVGKASRIGH